MPIHPALRKVPFLVLALILLWGMAMAAGLKLFPPVYFDEVEYVNHAWNLSAGGRAEYSLYDDVYPKNLYEFRHAWPPLIRPFYVRLLSAVVGMSGAGLWSARLLSLAGGVLSLLVFYRVSVRLFEREAFRVLALAFLAMQMYFIHSARFARPEIFLALAGILAFICFLKTSEDGGRLWAALAGFLAAASAGVHTNGIALLGALTALWIPFQGRRLLRHPPFYYFIAGALAGLTAYVHCSDWDGFLPGSRFLFFQHFNKPPLMSGTGPLQMAAEELTRYYQPWPLPTARFGLLWEQAQGVWAGLSLSAFVYHFAHFRREKAPMPWRLTIWMGVFLFGFYALLVGYRAPVYSILLLPFTALAVAGWLAGRGHEAIISSRKPERALFFGAALCLLPLLWPMAVGPLFLFVFMVLSLGLADSGKTSQRFLLWTLTAGAAFLIGLLWSVPVFLKSGMGRMQEGYSSWGAGSLAGLGGLAILSFYSKKALPQERLSQGAAACLPWIFGGAFLLSSAIFLASEHGARPSYEQVLSEVRARVPAGTRVAGPMVLWFGLADREFRDIGGLDWHRLLTAERDPAKGLADFRPEYVVLDDNALRYFLAARQTRADRKPDTYLLPWRHSLLASLPSGPHYGGRLHILRLDENGPANP